MFKLKILQI